MKKEILEAAKECFESNEKLTGSLFVTSDLMCFEKSSDATSHSHSLKDETIEVVSRELAETGGKSISIKPEFTVAQMVEKFAGATTANEVDALIAEGESRKGVLDGATSRKAEIAGA